MAESDLLRQARTVSEGDEITVEYTGTQEAELEKTGTVVDVEQQYDERLEQESVFVDFDDADGDRHRLRVSRDDVATTGSLESVRYDWSHGERTTERGTHRISRGRTGVDAISADDDSDDETFEGFDGFDDDADADADADVVLTTGTEETFVDDDGFEYTELSKEQVEAASGCFFSQGAVGPDDDAFECRKHADAGRLYCDEHAEHLKKVRSTVC